MFLCTQKMCPNVARFRVDSEDALEAGSEGRHGWPVPMQQEVIILQPIREDIMRDDTPSALPHLRHKIKSITVSSLKSNPAVLKR